jgi:hypothetical protein
VERLYEPAYDAWDTHGGRRLFAGVAAVGKWALMVEPNGFLGVTDGAIAPVSRGTEAVSHSCNVNGVAYFTWFQDGEQRLFFPPDRPYDRHGSCREDMVEAMEEAGFDLRDTESMSFESSRSTAFALAARVTGVRLTPGLLRTADFVGGTAPTPSR